MSVEEQQNDLTGSDDLLTGCGASLPCDPRRRLHRYLMLIFICFLSFGSYFCYDSPAALQDVMIQDLQITTTQFMNFYAFYSWPNVALSFVGGYLIDRVFGIRWGAIIFALFVLSGQLLFGIGVYVNNIGLIYFARLIFGIGGESLAVAQNTYATEWFASSELNFVFGLQLSMSRIGSTVAMLSMQPLNAAVKALGVSGYKQIGVSLLIVSITCLFSCCCAFSLSYFTARSKRILRIDRERQFKENLDQSSGGEVKVRSASEAAPKIKFRDIIHFPGALWLICIICVAYYVAVFPFISLGLVFFERKFELPVLYAITVNSLVYIISAAASPIFGLAIDFTGRNLFWVITGVLLTMLCHICFAFTNGALPPIVIMITMGLAYSILASSLWPMVGYILPPYQRGTAYGLIQSVQNLGLGAIAIFAGFLVDTKGYLFLEMFFIICLSVTVASVLGLFVWDTRNGSILNRSGKVRRAELMQGVRNELCSTKDELGDPMDETSSSVRA